MNKYTKSEVEAIEVSLDTEAHRQPGDAGDMYRLQAGDLIVRKNKPSRKFVFCEYQASFETLALTTMTVMRAKITGLQCIPVKSAHPSQQTMVDVAHFGEWSIALKEAAETDRRFSGLF